MSLYQITSLAARVLFGGPFGTVTRINLTACSREKLCNNTGASIRKFHKASSSNQWAHVVKLLFGKQKSARESLGKVLELLRKQCNVYVAQRLRRMGQTINLYTVLYSEASLQSLATNFARRYMKGRRRPFYVLFGGACCVADKDRISENELKNRCADDLDLISEIKKLPSLVNVAPKHLQSWEAVINKEEIRVWKRPIENTSLFEFKVYGRFNDISANSFFRVQLDLDYRKIWDKYVIQLDCVDKDPETESEVIHWVTHFPFPLHSRDYVYTRRFLVDHKKKTMMFVSRGIDHPLRPATNKHVRVTNYFSQMVIKPHNSFDEHGFDYVLTYYDDPQANNVPQFCINWVTNKGCPDYVSRLHEAAKQLEDPNNNHTCVPSSSSTNVKEFQSQKDDKSKSYSGNYA